MFYRKRLGQRKPRKVVKKRINKKRGLTKAVKSYVKKQIHNQIENKLVITSAINQTIVTASSGSTPAYINLIPQVTQGNASNGRIGDVVNFRRCYVKGYVNLLPYNSLTNFSLPIRVKMWLVSYKPLNTTITSGVLPSTNNFFQINGNTQTFQGNMTDMVLPCNAEAWKVHQVKEFELGQTIANAGGFGASSVVWADNSKFQIPFYFSFGKHLGRCKYNDGENFPTNKNIYLVIQAVTADGSSSALTSAEFHYCLKNEFEDA